MAETFEEIEAEAYKFATQASLADIRTHLAQEGIDVDRQFARFKQSCEDQRRRRFGGKMGHWLAVAALFVSAVGGLFLLLRSPAARTTEANQSTLTSLESWRDPRELSELELIRLFFDGRVQRRNAEAENAIYVTLPDPATEPNEELMYAAILVFETTGHRDMIFDPEAARRWYTDAMINPNPRIQKRALKSLWLAIPDWENDPVLVERASEIRNRLRLEPPRVPVRGS